MRDNIITGLLLIVLIHTIITEKNIEIFTKVLRESIFTFFAFIAAVLLALSGEISQLADSLSDDNRKNNCGLPSKETIRVYRLRNLVNNNYSFKYDDNIMLIVYPDGTFASCQRDSEDDTDRIINDAYEHFMASYGITPEMEMIEIEKVKRG